MRRNLFYALVICLFAASCEKSEQVKPNMNLEKRQLTISETVLKNNLDKTARIFSQLLTDKDVNKEMRDFSSEKSKSNKIYFKRLFEESKEGSSVNFKSLRANFLKVVSSQKGDEDLAQYLADNNCYIYRPYPLEWYDATKKITIVGHPMDNDIEGVGYIESNSKLIQETIVDEEYADENPVLLILPLEPGEEIEPQIPVETETTPDPPFGTDGSGLNSHSTVYIGYFRCSDYCGGLFEGDIEIRIKRVSPKFNLSTQTVEVTEPVEIHVNYQREYAKAAVKGWNVYKNGGWKKVNVVWDTDWTGEKDRQGIIVYDYDWNSSIRKTTVGVSYKGIGLNLTLERDVKYEGDFLGKNDQWWRTWFYSTQAVPTPYDDIKYGYTVRKTGSDVKFTTPTWTVYY